VAHQDALLGTLMAYLAAYSKFPAFFLHAILFLLLSLHSMSACSKQTKAANSFWCLHS